jgi:hypothetical protein
MLLCGDRVEFEGQFRTKFAKMKLIIENINEDMSRADPVTYDTAGCHRPLLHSELATGSMQARAPHALYIFCG